MIGWCCLRRAVTSLSPTQVVSDAHAARGALFGIVPRMTAIEGGALWTRIRHLLDRVAFKLDQAGLLDDFVDTMLELCGGELGAIATDIANPPPRILSARSRRRDALPNDRLELVGLITAHKLPDGGPSLGNAGERAHLVIPVRQGGRGRAVGVLVFVFPRGATVSPGVLELVESFASLASLVLGLREEVETANERARASQVVSLTDVVPPSLDELLASESMHPLRADIDAAILGDAPLFILGESGTGKTQLASAIAHASGRSPIVRAVLGASDDLNTITSELFGHERGAFSGAVDKRKDLVEYADGGTLILDEVLNLPPHAQQLLLDFTQFGTYRPLGYQGSEPKVARVRIIAATNGNIDQAIRDTRFRQDLFFRLAALRLDLPPLRSRPRDIANLSRSFLRRFDPLRGWELSPEAERRLCAPSLEWAGNVRQLEGVLRRARDRALANGQSGGALQSEHFAELERQVGTRARAVQPTSEPPVVAPELSTDAPTSVAWASLLDQKRALDAMERDIIQRAMNDAHGNASLAARTLGVSRTSLLSRINTLGVSSGDERP